MLEATRKNARASAKLMLRLEELDKKVDAGFAELRAGHARTSDRDARDAAGVILDALDALDRALEAAATIPSSSGSDGMTTGLRIASDRLTASLAAQGIERVADVVGAPPDGRTFCVVGVESAAELDDGVVVRVVRAAARQGDRLLREGSVIVNRRGTGEETSEGTSEREPRLADTGADAQRDTRGKMQ